MSSYKKLQKLGSGAFATTFLVEEVGKGGGAPSDASSKKQKQLVMKRVPCKHMRAANAALQEVKVLLSCHHDGIVAYHDFFLDTDSDENIVICLVMEFCDSGDLWEKIANARRSHTPLEPQLVAGYTLQLVSALRYLHARSILHRDIKPENVFLTDDGMVAKLGDFGLATATEDLDAGAAKTQVGTPDYMAPEVLTRAGYGRECDWWSFGCILFEMLVGYAPFYAETQQETADKVLRHTETLAFPPEASLSPEARSLIQALLTTRDERLTVEGIKAHPFFAGVDWEGLREAPPPHTPTILSETDTQHFEEFEPTPPGQHVAEERRTPRAEPRDAKAVLFAGFSYARPK